MKTDAAFFEIFETNPDRLEELTGRSLPKFISASSEALKNTIQVECDLLFKPADPNDSEWIVEIQMYFDQSIFNRADLARAMVWKNRNSQKKCLLKGFQTSEVRGMVIFGDAAMLPSNTERHPHIEYVFLDDLLAKLKKKSPGSPLIAVLAPLYESDEELEKQAAQHYDVIRKHSNLNADERDALGDVFIHFFSQRFKNLTYQQIRKMIAELTPIEKTQVGKDLIEKGKIAGKKEGKKEERRKLARSLEKSGMTIEAIAKAMNLKIEEIKVLLAAN